MKKFVRNFLALLLAGGVSGLFAQARTLDVWDFGGVEENGATNHISISDIENIEALGDDGKFTESGEISFGDLTFKADKNDSSFNGGSKNAGKDAFAYTAFSDGYKAGGAWACGGKGGETKRYLLLNNVKSGDLVSFYAMTSNGESEKIHFVSLDEEGERDDFQDDTASITKDGKTFTYIAYKSGSYKIYCDASAGKPVYFRVKRERGVEVSGTLASLPQGNAELKFIPKDLDRDFTALISGKSYIVNLPAGHSFTVSLGGIKGYGVNAASKKLELASDSAESLKKDLVIAVQTAIPVSGKITGFSSGYVLQPGAKVLMTPPANSKFSPSELEIKVLNGDYTYTGEIEPSVSYQASIEGANDYQLTGDSVFEGTASFEKNISVKACKTFDVSGKFFGEIKEFPKSVKFKNVDDGYVYDGRVSTLNYSVQLREGVYEVICETSIAHSVNHIVVEKGAVIKDIKLSLKESTIRPLPPKKELWVGNKRGQYASVAEAIAAARAMNPLQERDRITILITPGVYRNQLIVDVPYITLKNADPAKEVKLTWYYGEGYKYYSANEDGWYNEDLAYDKFEKKTTAKSGVASYIKSSARAFHAEGITFESSFNRYMTDEELADGIECQGSSFVRKLNSDVRSLSAAGKSSALVVEANESEFVDCKVLGSLNTFVTGSDIKGYLRRCFIEGNDEIISGGGDFIFENCELRLAGFSDQAKEGFVTAPSTAQKAKGYLFYNCLISASSNAKNAPASFGHPLSKDAAAAFVNTVYGMENIIIPAGWSDSEAFKAESVRFREINTSWSGSAVKTDERVKDTIPQITKDYTLKAFLGQWKPEYYTEAKKEKIKLKKPLFTSDDDIASPHPGHTLTLSYTFGAADSEDISLLKWYRDKDGKSELIKQSTGYGDKTYLIQKEDSDSIIRCLIVPQIRSGDSSKPVEAKLDKKVNGSYTIPVNAVVENKRIKGSVKVFLASDSTCKDYSGLGMWQAGKINNEGGWGEFLQSYFNGAVSVENYAQSGHSSRSFINEGLLDKIEVNITKGDYLFIQFGHNDCLSDSNNLDERYVPLGKPDKKGIYLVTPGKKGATPENLSSRYGETFYSYDCGGTYKWYLKQYIEVARKAGATPVLVTPVSRLYYTSDGKIRPHHDSSENGNGTQTTENNAYVEAMKQLAKEEKVILIDGFEMTKALYERAYADKKDDSEARNLMFEGDSTHTNKLGAFVLAGLFAKAIKVQIPSLAKGIIHPSRAMGENFDGSLLFTVDSTGKFSCPSEYWTNYTQKFLDGLVK